MEMNGMEEDVRVICIIKLQQSNHMVGRHNKICQTTRWWQKQNNLATFSSRSPNFLFSQLVCCRCGGGSGGGGDVGM